MQNDRANAIDVYISDHPEDLIGTRHLILSGVKTEVFDYRLPTYLLCYNVDNGRFALEKLVKQEEVGHELDPILPDDAQIIKQMLIDLQQEKTRELKSDLRKYGQLDPGVITYDGFVINGNRRMAIFEDLQQEDGTGRWEKLDVMRLPSGVSARDLWRLEAGLQLSQEQRAEYGPVNELLKIREGKVAKLTTRDIAASMFGWTEEKVDDAIERLELIDEFLDWSGQSRNYPVIKARGLHEYFVDVQTHVLKPAKAEGLKARDLAQRKEQAFALIWATSKLKYDPNSDYRGKMSHWIIRDLRKVYSSVYAKDTFARVFGEQKKQKRESWQIEPELVRSAFDDAMDVIDNEEMQAKPMKLAEKALNALSALLDVDLGNNRQNISELANSLDQLDMMLNNLRDKYNLPRNF